MTHRFTQKEVHLLSGPSELQPVTDCVTQYTPREKDQDLLQLPDASEVQKLKSPTQIQQHTRHYYSQLTENEKAKFQNPFTYNDQRNFVECNPVKKISDDLVYLKKSHTSSVSDSIFSEEREEIAKDVPAPTEDVPAPTPAPADTLEKVEGQPYTPGSRKSMKKNFGRPASAYSESRGTTLHSRIKEVNEEELWKLNCRYFYTRSVSCILAVQGRKISHYFHSQNAHLEV